MAEGSLGWIYDSDDPTAKPRRISTAEKLAKNVARDRLRRGLRARESFSDEDLEEEEQRLAAEVAAMVAAGKVQIFPPGWSRYE